MVKSMFKKFVFTAFVLAITIASFTVASKYIVAQDARAPEDIAGADAIRNLGEFPTISEEDILERLFPNNKETCSKKAGLFMAVVQQYREGETVDQIASIAMMKPVFQGYYDSVQQNGVAKASIDNIKEYQQCVRSSRAHEDSSKENALRKRHNACVKLSDTVLKTLSLMEQRKSVKTAIAEYQANPVNLSGTVFERIDNPVFMLIGQMYQTKRKKSYEDAVMMGHGFITACAA